MPGKSHGQRSLVGYSPWGCKEPDTTERLSQGESDSVCTWLPWLLASKSWFSELLMEIPWHAPHNDKVAKSQCFKAFLGFFNSIFEDLHLPRKLSWPKVDLRKPAQLPPVLSQISLPWGKGHGTISRRLSLHTSFASVTSVLERALVLIQLQLSAARFPLMRI